VLAEESTVSASRAIVRRDRADLGGPNAQPPAEGTSCCSTERRAPPRSRQRQVSPRSSPRRIPVVAARRQSGNSLSPWTCSRKRASSFAVHACAGLLVAAGGSAMSAGLRTSFPQRTASRRARCRTAWVCLVVPTDRPACSRRGRLHARRHLDGRLRGFARIDVGVISRAHGARRSVGLSASGSASWRSAARCGASGRRSFAGSRAVSWRTCRRCGAPTWSSRSPYCRKHRPPPEVREM
jgi:hypothetical protein